MIRIVTNWINKEYENLDIDNPLCYIKAAGLGCIEGIIDGFTIVGGICVISNIVKKIVHKD